MESFVAAVVEIGHFFVVMFTRDIKVCKTFNNNHLNRKLFPLFILFNCVFLLFQYTNDLIIY